MAEAFDLKGILGDDVDLDDPQIQNFVKRTQEKLATSQTAMTTTDAAFSFSDSDLEGLPGVAIADPDATIPRFPIERYVVKAAQKDRVSPLSNNKYLVKYHWDDLLKTSVMCFGGSCCEDLGAPTVRFVRPIVQYETDNKGVVTSEKVALRVMRLAQNGEDQFQTINQQTPDLSAVDLIVSSNNPTYQDYQIMPVSTATWKKNPNMLESIKQQWNQNKKYLFDAIATCMTEEEYFKKKTAAKAGQ